MLRSRSFDLVNKTIEQDHIEEKNAPRLKGSVGADLHHLEEDRAILTEPGESRRRRTIRLTRSDTGSWGFTLQTYGVRNKRTCEIDTMSYVDYVEIRSAAWLAGLRQGDIILSVNGDNVEPCTHTQLVNKIQKTGQNMRLVVLFENCCKKVELYERYLKLKKLLSEKIFQYRQLEEEEKRLSGGELDSGFLLSRSDLLRQSTSTTYSSVSGLNIYTDLTPSVHSDLSPSNSKHSDLNSRICQSNSTTDTHFTVFEHAESNSLGSNKQLLHEPQSHHIKTKKEAKDFRYSKSNWSENDSCTSSIQSPPLCDEEYSLNNVHNSDNKENIKSSFSTDDSHVTCDLECSKLSDMTHGFNGSRLHVVSDLKSSGFSEVSSDLNSSIVGCVTKDLEGSTNVSNYFTSDSESNHAESSRLKKNDDMNTDVGIEDMSTKSDLTNIERYVFENCDTCKDQKTRNSDIMADITKDAHCKTDQNCNSTTSNSALNSDEITCRDDQSNITAGESSGGLMCCDDDVDVDDDNAEGDIDRSYSDTCSNRCDRHTLYGILVNDADYLTRF